MQRRVWARALGTIEAATTASALTGVSRTLDHLAVRNLITWEREGPRGREITVTLLREDATGKSYTRPGKDDNDAYIQLVDAYWRKELDQTLTLPGIAMLLVASAEYRMFPLATERMPEWYGWSADTAERGFRDLQANGVITWMAQPKIAPNAPLGYTLFNHYALSRPFRHRSRTHVKKSEGQDQS
jgi:hypothetical protein